ncbi:TraB/GumN family protein [Sphingobium sp. LB126]|uniref:TraB/GumN family protein n=1 Tax=Sphingobium sp. LB126 TaxID=1983755 RepID=UPI00241333C2|nr:TraB/GumN family protein [Sphingobium sp. LB126]
MTRWWARWLWLLGSGLGLRPGLRPGLGLGLAALFLIVACGSQPPAPPPGGGPALWRIEGKGIDGWLFGTIHVLPDNVQWRTAPIGDAVARADRLVLESAEIQDQARTLALFEKMGRSPGLPPLETRVPGKDKAALNEIANKGARPARPCPVMKAGRRRCCFPLRRSRHCMSVRIMAWNRP